ncbi:Ulp1 family isopeptidase [Ideonella sp. YS5]|uniref:Ulp1 family isopeptidase n=1 Tax=Ideonella sp. YS5 TaxID=3453714 RepID=UPI003EF01181
MKFPGDTSRPRLDLESHRQATAHAVSPPAQAAPAASTAQPAGMLGRLSDLQRDRRQAGDAAAALAPRSAMPGISGAQRMPGSPAASPARDERQIPGAGAGPSHAGGVNTEARAAVHDGPLAQGAAPQAADEPRVRARDDAADFLRRQAGAAMHAGATTLPPPDFATHRQPHAQDLPLIDRVRQGLEMAMPPLASRTKASILGRLTQFSAWLRQIDRPAMDGRLFSDQLMSDAWKLVRLGGDNATPAALRHLCHIEASRLGVAEVPRIQRRYAKAVPEADRAFIDAAFGASRTEVVYRHAAHSFSEWLAVSGHPALTDPVHDPQGLAGPALHADHMDELVRAYVQSPNAAHPMSVGSALKQLRLFDLHGATNIGTQSRHLGIPEVDLRLIDRYLVRSNAELRAKPAPEPKSRDARPKVSRHTKFDTYARKVRNFSDWRQQEGLPPIASRLGDPALLAEVGAFAEPGTSMFNHTRLALRQMAAMFPPELPELTFARIGHVAFVNALGALASHASVDDAAQRVGVNVDDLLVFLDARAMDGLTDAGRQLVESFDGRARQGADANIELRRQAMAAGRAARPGPEQAPPPRAAAAPRSRDGGARGSAADSIFNGLSSIDSVSSLGSRRDVGVHAPAVGPQPAPMDSTFSGLSSIGSVSSLGSPRDPGVNASAVGRHPAPADSTFDGLSSIGSVSSPGSRRDFDLNTPAIEEPPAPAGSAFDSLSSIAPLSRLGGGRSVDPGTPSQEVTGPARAAPAIGDVDRRVVHASAAARLASDPWLGDEDIHRYATVALHRIADEIGPRGHAMLGQLAVANPAQTALMLDGDAAQRADVLQHLTAPIVFLPVNGANRHWSLLVVDRASGQAVHYDSLIHPMRIAEAASTAQFRRARDAAVHFGIAQTAAMPTAPQNDGHSCGDHVAAGIEELARRLLNRGFQGVSLDLRGIVPSRARVIELVTEHERFAGRIHARQAAPASDSELAGPSKKRR